MACLLVTGGAGYIGSITCELLLRKGLSVVVLDDLSRGHRGAIPQGVPFYQGSVGDRRLVAQLIRRHRVTGCVHFAAHAYVGESVERPDVYYGNNVAEGIAFLGELVANRVPYIVFSSSCAVYGQPPAIPVAENCPLQPTSPYGRTKVILEQALADYSNAYGLRWVALRYFNAAGAVPNKGEDHYPETHLIPLAIRAALGHSPHLDILGCDYPTRDGTAVRDYVHVADLAQAHWLACRYLEAGGRPDVFNLGAGSGHSVLEVIDAVKKASGADILTVLSARRDGDPAELVADHGRASNVLGWHPERSGIDKIVQSAFLWHSRDPLGYDGRHRGVPLGTKRTRPPVMRDISPPRMRS